MSLGLIVRYSWKTILGSGILATLICVLYEYYGFKQISIPFQPIATIGTAVAFYLGFKNNSSYDRTWEGRKIWGSLVNNSRTFGSWVVNWIGTDETNNTEELHQIKKELIYRHIAYINILRTQLRKVTVWDKHKYYDMSRKALGDSVEGIYKKNMKLISDHYLNDEEKVEVLKMKNGATYLLAEQSKQLTQLKRKGLLTEFEHSDVEKLIQSFYADQGASERIKTFPLPRQYGFFSKVFVIIFCFLLPFGLVNSFSENGLVWLSIPISMLVSWIFITMEDVGDSSENPFENGTNDVPLTAICRTIEIDLKQMLGEENIPEKIAPVNNVLM